MKGTSLTKEEFKRATRSDSPEDIQLVISVCEYLAKKRKGEAQPQDLAKLQKAIEEWKRQTWYNQPMLTV